MDRSLLASQIKENIREAWREVSWSRMTGTQGYASRRKLLSLSGGRETGHRKGQEENHPVRCESCILEVRIPSSKENNEGD